MGLPRRKVENPGTMFGIEVDEPRWSLDPRLRRDMAQEQQIGLQEQSLDAQQAQLARQQRIMQAEDAAVADLEAGADIGNIFKNNPSLALSRNFNQFAGMQQMVQPSKAASTLAPSLAKSLAPQSREKFFNLIQTPQFANDPLGAMTQVQLDEEREKQHGELEKAGISNYPKDKLLSPPEMARMIREASNKGKDPAMEAMEKQMGMLRDELKFMADSGDFEIPNPSASASDPSIPKFIPRPEYAARQKKLMELSDRYQSYLEGIHSPQQAAAAAAGAPPPPPAEPQVGFKERIKGLAGGQPKEQIIAPVKDEEILAALNSPSVDENTFIAAATSPSTSLEVKKQALEKLRQFAKEPKFPAGTTVMQAKERLGAINDKIAEAERAVRMEPERQKLNQAWTQEKSQMATYIKDFAKSLGLKPDLVENSLAINELTDPNPEYPVTIRAEFDAFLRNKKGVKGGFLDMQADKLLPFTGSEFAGDFGMEGVIPGFRRFGKGKTYGDVLDAYLAEKVPTSATSPQNQVAQPASTVKIKSVTLLP